MAKRASIHCHYILHSGLKSLQKKSKPWPCSFGSWRYLYSKSQSVGFQHVEMTTATLALCGRVCSWNSLKHTRFWTPIFNEIWMKCHLDEGKKKDQRQATKPKLFQVETTFEALKLPVPSPATVPVWLVWKNGLILIRQLYRSPLRWIENCGKNIISSNTSQSMWKAKWLDPQKQCTKKPVPLEAQMVSWFDVKH